MTTSTKLQAYGWTTIAFHWLSVIAVAISFLTGTPLGDVGREGQDTALADHLFWASLLAVPLLARIAWRMSEGFLRTSDQVGVLRIISRVVMVGLLLSVGGAVVTGFLLPWSLGNPLDIGVVSIGSPLPRSAAMHALLASLHDVFAYLWLPLLAVHILGALKHFLVDGDDVFIGMLISNREEDDG